MYVYVTLCKLPNGVADRWNRKTLNSIKDVNNSIKDVICTKEKCFLWENNAS